MFYDCNNFNQSLNEWNVSNVICMDSMFYDCNNFNQPVDKWNISSVKDVSFMFAHCHSFNQCLNNWCSTLVNCNFYIITMFYDSGMQEINYPKKRRIS